MWFTNLKAYLKFLGRNKLYSFVTVFGFAVSLMFVLLLGIYVKKELSVDQFHEKKDRIYLIASSQGINYANPTGDFVKDRFAEVETYTRILLRKMPVTINSTQEKITAKTLFADKDFFNIFSFPLEEGNASQVLQTKQSVVLSRQFADQLFPDENPIGKTIRMESGEITVTGIMKDFPQNTQLPQSDMVVNYEMLTSFWGNDILTTWNNSSFNIYFLAKPGTDLPSKAPLLYDLFKKDYWIFKDGFANKVMFIPLTEVYFNTLPNKGFEGIRQNSRARVSVFFAITLLILIVAILNYINLSVSQAGSRGKEAATKKLLGCKKRDLILQFITESSLMIFCSFLIGILLAFFAEPFFNDVLSVQLLLKEQFTPSFIVLLAGSILLTGIISGIIPALIISNFEPLEVVKGSFTKKVKTTYSKILITVQYVVAISLLICSTVIIRQNNFLQQFDLGYDKDNLFIMSNVLPTNRLPGLKDKLEKIPGVDKVIFTAGSPVDGGNNNSFEYEGQSLSFQTFGIDSSFFDFFNIRVTPTGIPPGGENTLWINQKAFDILRPDSISFSYKIEDNTFHIAGIVDNFNFRSLHQPIGPASFYLLREDSWVWSILIKLNPGTDIYETANQLKEAYKDYNGGELFESYFADREIQSLYEQEEKTSKIIWAFTLLTLIILMMGILAMSLYFVRQKEKEIAIRKVNGATEKEVMLMLNMNFIIRILIAFAIAVPFSYYIMQRWLENFAYKGSLHPLIFVFSGIFIGLLSVVFVSLQSWKAATANPVKAIKSE